MSNTDTEHEIEVSTNGSGSGSVVDLIKQDIKEISEIRDVTIPVPGYDASGLSIKFRLALPGEINTLNTKVEKQFPKKEDEWKRNVAVAMDTIIVFCDGFYVKPDGVDEYVMLDPTGDEVPVKFDDRLCSVVGLPEGSSAREILKKLFDSNEMRIINFAEKVGRWQTNTKADLDKEIWQLGG